MKEKWMIVAPLVGAWIEIIYKCFLHFFVIVAPLVGAWIEIKIAVIGEWTTGSVAPLVGAWIEIGANTRI